MLAGKQIRVGPLAGSSCACGVGTQKLWITSADSLVIRAERVGRYRSQCAEFCGTAHAQMALTVVVEPQAAYEAWLDAQRAPAREPQSELAREGRNVFLNRPCVTCHAISGTNAQANVGPDLSHLASHGVGCRDVPKQARAPRGLDPGRAGLEAGRAHA